MALLDEPVASAVSAAIGAVGISVTILEETRGYVPETGTEVESSENSYSVMSSPPIDVEIEQDQAKTKALKLVIPGNALPFEPVAEKHKVILAGVSYQIARVRSICSGDSVAAYIIFLRK